MSWEETSPGVFRAPLGGIESFFVLLCKPNIDTGREHWTVALDATIHIHDLPSGTSVESQLREAWLALRFEHPALAAELNSEAQEKTYSATTQAAAKEWVKSTFNVHDEAATVEGIVSAFKSQKFPQLHWLPHTSQIMFQISHWRIDGRGILMLMDRYLTLFSTVSPASSLQWGSEGENLTPSIEAANNVPTTSSDFAKNYAQDRFTELISGFPATGVTVKNNGKSPPTSSHRTALIFTRDSTTTLLKSCKAHNFSITSACQAAAAYTTYNFAPEHRKSMSFTSLLGIDMRPHFPAPLNTWKYAVNNYIAGHYLFLQPSSMGKDNFISVARDIDAQARHKFVASEYMESVREICTTLTPLLVTPPPDDFPPLSEMPISSLGMFEKYVRPVYGGEGNGKVEVKDLRLAIEMATMQIALHLWTWRGRFHVSASFNEAFHDKVFVEECLVYLKGVLETGLGIELELDGLDDGQPVVGDVE